MHIVLARYCYRNSSVRPSVCPSVRLSVTLLYAGHIAWTSSKLITRISSLQLGTVKTAAVRLSGWLVGKSCLSRVACLSVRAINRRPPGVVKFRVM